MTKVEFLKQMERRLQVLNQEERNEILEEYAQHLELKMASGLKEEEAIRHFGDVDVLADEILDAYHVNLNYKKESRKIQIGAVGEKVSSGAGTLWQKLKAVLRDITKSAKDLFEKLKDCCKRKGEPELLLEDGEGIKYSKTKWSWKKISLLWLPTRAGREQDGRMLAGIQKVCRGIIEGGMRLLACCWRLSVLGFLIPVVFCIFFTLILLGALIVIVLLGYPLLGVTLITLGALVCGITLVWLVWEVVFVKREEKTWG